MIEADVKLGDTVPLNFQLFDGAVDKFVRAIVFDQAGISIGSSPHDLTHVKNGYYHDRTLSMPNKTQLTAVYLVFEDALFTILSELYTQDADIFRLLPDSEVIFIESPGDKAEVVLEQQLAEAVIETTEIVVTVEQDETEAVDSSDKVTAEVVSSKIKAETDC